MLFIFKMFPKISVKGFQPGIQGHSDNFVTISPAFCRQSVIALICWFQLSNFISSLWTFKIPVCSLFVALWLCRYFLHSFKMSTLMQRPRQIWKQKFPTPKKGMWMGSVVAVHVLWRHTWFSWELLYLSFWIHAKLLFPVYYRAKCVYDI